jgi:hypothetical protein
MFIKALFINFLLAILFFSIGCAQDNTVVSGDTYTGVGGTVSMSVGQLNAAIVTGGGNEITEGVQQSFRWIQLQAKVLLSGPFDTGNSLMIDSLRTKGLIPLVEPYGTLNSSANPYASVYTHVNGGGGELTTNSVLSISGNNAIVDWVFVQLRSAADSSVVVATRSALIQRDGDIVDIDGVSPLQFYTQDPNNYFVSVKHRNHLGVMTANYYSFNGTPTLLDFTLPSTNLYTKAFPNNNPMPLSGATRIQNSKRTLYGGNCNISNAINNKNISYTTASPSDRSALLMYSGATGTVNGYSVYDCDLNGSARFSGLNPDRNVILNSTNNSSTIVVNEQLP